MINHILAYPSGIPFDNPIIRFYGIIVVFSALTSAFLSNYRAHKDGYSWQFLSSLFIPVFLIAIVGARTWYVIASFKTEFISEPWYKVFFIWEGGIAIQGGVIAGVIAGVALVLTRRKGAPILRVADFIVPTLLISQFIGRWGNFFNQEVYGHNVALDAWSFLPSFITNNMGTSGMLSSGTIWAPLFAVEAVANLMFYFLISYALPAVLGKHYKDGDTAFAYFIAYGLVRMILEPLRNPAYIMGVSTDGGNIKNYKSFIMAIIFIGVGVIAIVLNHVLRHFLKGTKFDKFINQVGYSEEYVTENVNVKEEDIGSIDESKLEQFEELNKKGDEKDD